MPDQHVESVAPAPADPTPLAHRPAATLPQLDLSCLELLELADREGRVETWVARLLPSDDSAPLDRLTATRLPLGPGPVRERLRRRLGALTEVDEPCVLRPQATIGVADVTWVISDGEPGVSLHRLLSRATLRPSQVVHVGFGLLTGLTALHHAGLHHGAVRAESVSIGANGSICLAGVADMTKTTRRSAAARHRDLEMASHLLAGMLPRPGPRSRFRQREQAATEGLRARLAGPGLAELGDARTALAAFALAAGDLGTDTARARAAAGLAALVPWLRRRPGEVRSQPSIPPVRGAGLATRGAPGSAAPIEIELVGRTAGGDAAPAPPPWVSPPLTVAPPPWVTPPLTIAPPPRRRLRLGLAVAAMVAVVLGVVVGVRIAHRGGTAPAAATAAPPNPRGAVTAAPAARAGALPTAAAALIAPAPGRAGDVSGVAIGPAAGSTCAAAPGAVCNVVVHVSLGPHATEPVAWSLVLVDRCTGASRRAPGSGVEGLVSYQYVYDTTPVTFTTAHPTALYAVTSAPEVAASPPLLVAGAVAC